MNSDRERSRMPLPDSILVTDLPDVLAGPLLRRLEPGRLVLWLVASRPLQLTLRLAHGEQPASDQPLGDDACQRLVVGEHAVIHLIDLHLDTPLPQDTRIDYDLLIDGTQGIAISCCARASISCCMAPAANRTMPPMTGYCVPTACWPRPMRPTNGPRC